jgi:hypothetical protein
MERASVLILADLWFLSPFGSAVLINYKHLNGRSNQVLWDFTVDVSGFLVAVDDGRCAKYSTETLLLTGLPKKGRVDQRVGPQIAVAGCNPVHWPAGGCQSSSLFPSGSMTQANFPYSDSSIFSSTLQPSSRKTLTNP